MGEIMSCLGYGYFVVSVGKHKVYSAEIPLTIQTFARKTKSVSSAKYPILAAAIPIYDWLIDKLKEFKAQSGITEKMSNALEMDLDKLQEYCERSADCYMYPVATRGFIQLGALSPFTLVLNTNILKVLVPRLKLDYYKKKKWDKRWIAESKRIVAEIYEKHYRPSVTEASDHSDGDNDDELYQHLYAHNKADKRDELETYLSAPVISGRTDVLQWWKVYKFCHLISFQQRRHATI